LINTFQTSAQYPTFTYGLSVISGLSLILRVASRLPVPLSVRGLTMLIHAYQASPPTIFTTTVSSKLPCPRCQTHPLCYYVSLATCLPSWLPIRQRVTFKLAGLVYRSLHETFPTYLSSVLRTYTPTRSLRSSSAHLLVEPRLRLHLLLMASDLPDHEFGTLYQITSNLLPLYFNSLITGRLVNSPRL